MLQTSILRASCSTRRWTLIRGAVALLGGSLGSLVACRNMDSCCGLEVGELYEIELMSVIEVAVGESRDCARIGIEPSAAIGDTIRFEILSLRYSELMDCGEVHGLRISSATPWSFQHLVGVEMVDGGGVGINHDLYYSVLGGGVAPPPSHPATSWKWSVMAQRCAGVHEAFDPQNPKLAFGIAHIHTTGPCTEAWAAKLTRVDE